MSKDAVLVLVKMFGSDVIQAVLRTGGVPALKQMYLTMFGEWV
jgi:hypothetical protein